MATQTKPKYRKSVKITVVNCMDCPHCDTKLTKGFGFATDYFCKATTDNRIIAGYVEWKSEEPQDGKIPQWCPMASRR